MYGVGSHDGGGLGEVAEVSDVQLHVDLEGLFWRMGCDGVMSRLRSSACKQQMTTEIEGHANLNCPTRQLSNRRKFLGAAGLGLGFASLMRT